MIDRATTGLRIAVAGLGALGKTLYEALRLNGSNHVAALSSRATAGDPIFIDWKKPVFPDADIVWLCIPDDALATIAAITETVKPGQLWVHGSGARDLSVLEPLKRRGARVAAVHFLQTFTKTSGAKAFFEVPASILAEDDDDTTLLAGIVTGIGARPFRVDAASRTTLHLAAVLVSNMWVLLAAEANRLTQDAVQIPAMALFSSLMRNTLNNLESAAGSNPLSVLSGPLKRADAATIAGHLSLPQLSGELREAYKSLNRLGLTAFKDAGTFTEAHFNIEKMLDA
jgi:predicted short-subunit dehydrogenase-like oxidoreductase (DUF2520 family)